MERGKERVTAAVVEHHVLNILFLVRSVNAAGAAIYVGHVREGRTVIDRVAGEDLLYKRTLERRGFAVAEALQKYVEAHDELALPCKGVDRVSGRCLHRHGD